MKVTALLFAGLREEAGESRVEVDLPEGSEAGDLVAAVLDDPKRAKEWRDVLLYAVKNDYVAPDHPLCDGDEVALIPPVAGG